MQTLSLTKVTDFEARYIPVRLDNVTLYRDQVEASKRLSDLYHALANVEGATSPAVMMLWNARNYVNTQARITLRGE